MGPIPGFCVRNTIRFAGQFEREPGPSATLQHNLPCLSLSFALVAPRPGKKQTLKVSLIIYLRIKHFDRASIAAILLTVNAVHELQSAIRTILAYQQPGFSDLVKIRLGEE